LKNVINPLGFFVLKMTENFYIFELKKYKITSKTTKGIKKPFYVIIWEAI